MPVHLSWEAIGPHSLTTVFQPIVDGRCGDLFSLEALTRGPAGTTLEPPEALFAAARAAGVEYDLDLWCVAAALDRFVGIGAPSRLFLNVLPATLVTAGFVGWFTAAVESRGLAAQDVVIELTEHGIGEDDGLLRAATRALRAAGLEFAIDDLGAGSSGLRTWTELQPDYVKLDRFFVSAVDVDPVRAEMLRSILDIAHVIGSRVVAEGVETSAQCAGVLDLGVDYLQGHFISRPALQPVLSDDARRQIGGGAPAVVVTCAEQLAIPLPAIDSEVRVADVVELFRRHKDWTALAVVAVGRPIGLVRRDDLLTLLTRPLHPELFNRKPVTAVMDANPLLIDARARLDQLSRILTGRAATSRMDDRFVVTREGRYHGIGSGVDLLRQITSQQVSAARHCNPLTLLPGNRQIDEEITRLIRLGSRFHVCYLDIDSFKPYNDHYGYAQGDRVLLELAELVKQSCYPRIDFAGHIGGDDFILVMRSAEWSRRLRRLFDNFDAAARRHYSDAHLRAGRLQGLDREGRAREFPLMSLSIAALEVMPGRPADVASISDRLREIKRLAKGHDGHALLAADAAGNIAVLHGGGVAGTPENRAAAGIA